MAATLAEAIHGERITWEELHERYDPVLQMVDVLIGVVPNCDTYLEVWPVGFRTYNLMVPASPPHPGRRRVDRDGRGDDGLPEQVHGRDGRGARGRSGGRRELERRWMDGMPSDGAAARRRIIEDWGYDEPLLTHMLHTKPRRALAAMLRHNLDPEQSELGIGAKALAALVYATHAGNGLLAGRSAALAETCGIDPRVVDADRQRSGDGRSHHRHRCCCVGDGAEPVGRRRHGDRHRHVAALGGRDRRTRRVDLGHTAAAPPGALVRLGHLNGRPLADGFTFCKVMA